MLLWTWEGKRREEARTNWRAIREVIREESKDDVEEEVALWVKRKYDKHKDDMFKLVEFAKETNQFEKATDELRGSDKKQDDKPDAAPVFNKRLFASQGTVIMTREARRLMEINEHSNEAEDSETCLTRAEMLCLRCVTEGLKLVHKGQDFVKDVLSRVITYEVYNAFEYVPAKHWEYNLSCYYILNGAVEVTYDLSASEARNVYQANIIYSHGTGEYVGLVSSEGPSEDLAPPATIYTKEPTQFIRIDRQKFHRLMEKAIVRIDTRKRDFVSNHSFLAQVSEDVRDKILHKLSIQDYPANKILLSQGDLTENLHIVMSGRCQTYREVYIPEAERDALFYLTSREPEDFFGEECVLDREPSTCTVVTVTGTTILKLHKSALQMVNRDRLAKFIESARHEIPDDDELRNRGYKDSLWCRFKHAQVKGSLKEAGKLRYLSRQESGVVHERPPDEVEQHVENMRRFVMNGSQFEPLRVQSAFVRKDPYCLPKRPQTTTPFVSQIASSPADDVDGKHDVSEKDLKSEVDPEPEQEPEPEPVKSHAQEKPVRSKITEKHVLKAMESKENLMKVLDDHVEIPAHLKQAWKDEDSQESQNFMKNGVLVTMRSEDIVRKAKALADTYADKWKANTGGENNDDWDTVLHTENKDAKIKIQANRMRIKDLKRRLTDLQKRRDKARQHRQQRNEVKQSSMSVCDENVEVKTNKSPSTNIGCNSKQTKEKKRDERLEHLSDIEEDPDTLPMYRMTDERLKLLKSWDISNWSLLDGADSRSMEAQVVA